ncbi:helix-turn-helix domain-containing protein [Planctomycetota bacterium]
MNNVNPDLLTTSQVAKLCCVKPDTIRKWIKRGHLKSIQTAGGHHRIEAHELVPFLSESQELMTGKQNQIPQAMRCWEYLSRRGEVLHECQECVVYRIRAAWCFAVADLGCDIGHAKQFCSSTCEECIYYKRIKGMATNVLVITADTSFIALLKKEENEKITFRIARNAYEASGLIHVFRPAFVVVDRELIADRDSDLLENLATDTRIPGLKVIVAGIRQKGRRHKEQINISIIDGEINKPFTASQFELLMNSFPVEVPASIGA